MRRVFEHDTGALLGGVMAANDNPKALAQYPAADLNARLRPDWSAELAGP